MAIKFQRDGDISPRNFNWVNMLTVHSGDVPMSSEKSPALANLSTLWGRFTKDFLWR